MTPIQKPLGGALNFLKFRFFLLHLFLVYVDGLKKGLWIAHHKSHFSLPPTMVLLPYPSKTLLGIVMSERDQDLWGKSDFITEMNQTPP